ncbi:MAG: hydroxyethylthiazole kinase [Myxococcota bacterium]
MTHAQQAAESLTQLRAQNPLVHSITNYVSMDVSANTLLAVGASPAMVHAEAEVADFAQIASALVLNIGTLSPAWVSAMHTAAAVARSRPIPVVLDPVGVGATAYRTRVAADLVRGGLTVIRGNASEIMALAGAAAGPTRGVDSTAAVDEATAAATALAASSSAIVAVTGATDFVTDGQNAFRVGGGHPWMGKVTALGCSLSGVIGAFVAVRPDEPLAATVHALAAFGLAGAKAADGAEGPGTLRLRIMDALHQLTPQTVAAEADITAL